MTSSANAEIQRIGEPTLNGQRLPFSSAVRAGDTVYLSGALGVDADGRLADGMAAQARQAMGTAWRALGLDAVDESPGPTRVNPVLHIELDGPALRRIGVDFRR